MNMIHVTDLFPKDSTELNFLFAYILFDHHLGQEKSSGANLKTVGLLQVLLSLRAASALGCLLKQELPLHRKSMYIYIYIWELI